MRPILLIALLLPACASRRVAAPSTSSAHIAIAEQRVEVAKAAESLKAQVEELERMQQGGGRAKELAEYIEYKASLLLRDYRDKADRGIPDT